MNTLPLGPFARDLLTAPDIAAALIGVLKDYDVETSTDYLLKVRDLSLTRHAEWNRIIKGVLHRLNHFSPPFTYVGHHILDESVWGVWIDLSRLHEAEQEGRLTQGGPLTKGRSTYVLDVSGRGVRLFRRKGWERVWEDV